MRYNIYNTSEVNRVNILEKLNKLKAQNNWTDYKIAVKSGLSTSTVINIFSRNTIPRLDTLEAICSAFGLTLAQFFTEDERYVYLSESQFEMFDRWEKLPLAKKEAFDLLLKLIVEDDTKKK